MKILDAYLAEIRYRLPRNNREDILDEIRSALMDMIEERSPGADPSEATVKAVLKEYGSPKQVARQYRGQQALIGPQTYPVYMTVLKIVFIIVAALNVLGLTFAAISGSLGESGLFVAILETFGGLLSSLFTAFGIITLIFALIERFAAEELQAEIEEEWSPDDLAELEDKKRVKVVELAVEITLGIIFILLINLYLDRIGIYYLGDTGWVSAPILNNNILRYIPWLTAITALDIGLNLYLIGKDFWDLPASISKILLNAANIILLVAIIVGPALITISPTAWETLNLGIDLTVQQLSQHLNTGLNLILGLVIFGLLVDTITRVVQTFIKKSHTSIHFKNE